MIRNFLIAQAERYLVGRGYLVMRYPRGPTMLLAGNAVAMAVDPYHTSWVVNFPVQPKTVACSGTQILHYKKRSD